MDPAGHVLDLQQLHELKSEHEEDAKFNLTVDLPGHVIDLQQFCKLKPEHEEDAQFDSTLEPTVELNPEHGEDVQLDSAVELPVELEPEHKENVQFDSTVELPVVTSSAKEPRWEEHLKSDLGKYWELPERTTRRARKQTSFFSPC